MNRKSLKQTNPYLKDPAKRRKLMEESARSSFGVEGIKIDSKNTKKIKKPSRGMKKTHK